MKTKETITKTEKGTGFNKIILTKTVRESTSIFEISDLEENQVQLKMDKVAFALLQESLDRFSFLASSRTDDNLSAANYAFKHYIKNHPHTERQVEAMAYFGELCHAVAASIELFEPLGDAVRRHNDNT